MNYNLKLFVPVILITFLSCNNKSEDKIIARANRIHDRILTVDSHTDTPLRFMRPGFNFGEGHDSLNGRSKIDLPRIKEGKLDGIYIAAFVGQGDRDERGNLDALEEALLICDSIRAVVNRYPGDLVFSTCSDDLGKVAAKGKHAVYIGLENGYPLGKNVDYVDTFYNRGVRYITLCHSFNNDICDSSTDTVEHGGLSEFGREVVARMNDLGVMIDLSHASDESFYDVIELSRAPVIASHSCARALCDNPRNLSDEMLEALRDNGGVIQMCLLSDYVTSPEPFPERDSAKAAVEAKHGNYYDLDPTGREAFIIDWYAVDINFPARLATVSDVVDHIDHIVEVAGIDYVGIGSDFDGGGAIDGCYDVSEMNNITIELFKRGYSRKEIAKIWGGNLTRVLAQVENEAAKK